MHTLSIVRFPIRVVTSPLPACTPTNRSDDHTTRLATENMLEKGASISKSQWARCWARKVESESAPTIQSLPRRFCHVMHPTTPTHPQSKFVSSTQCWKSGRRALAVILPLILLLAAWRSAVDGSIHYKSRNTVIIASYILTPNCKDRPTDIRDCCGTCNAHLISHAHGVRAFSSSPDISTDNVRIKSRHGSVVRETTTHCSSADSCLAKTPLSCVVIRRSSVHVGIQSHAHDQSFVLIFPTGKDKETPKAVYLLCQKSAIELRTIYIYCFSLTLHSPADPFMSSAVERPPQSPKRRVSFSNPFQLSLSPKEKESKCV
jgi:hypothetical protein